MREDGGAQEHLEKTQCADTKFISEDREKTVEELGRETEFREDKNDGLEDDKKSVQDGPECARRLIWDSASPESIFLIRE